MQVDYSVELGRDDPALELPWSSEDAALRYLDLKQHPELLHEIPEASAFPELSAFLFRINMPEFPLQTAKCDAWHSREILPEEEIYGAECKFISYVDLVFTDRDARLSFEKHEELAQALCRLLKRAPDIAASVEFAIRRCYYYDDSDIHHSPESGRVSQRSGTTPLPKRSLPVDSSRDQSLQPASRADNQEIFRKLREAETPRPGERVGHPDSAGELYGIAHPEDLDDSQSGFYLTAYVTGFGNSGDEASQRWAITLTLLQHALVQVANS